MRKAAALVTERTSELLDLYDVVRVRGLGDRRFSAERYWNIIETLLERTPETAHAGWDREKIGESGEGRPLYLLSYGSGACAVLAWSQMHGDESTATMALADICAFLARHPGHSLARLLARRLRIHFLPILNPDGTARFERHNAAGIDINRDARRLATPEGRALKAAHERVKPTVGFNLHDQNPCYRVGESNRTAAIALLAPAYDPARTLHPRRERAMRVCAVVRRAVEPLVGGHITRYDDEFNPRAFGDLMGRWGTCTVLIESGGWPDDPEKQYLRKANYAGLLSALAAIADGSYTDAELAAYHDLPPNGALLPDLLVSGGTLVAPGLVPVAVDVLVEYEDPLRRTGATIMEVGDLAGTDARTKVSAKGLFLMPGKGGRDDDGRLRLGPGAPADLRLARDPEGREVVGQLGALLRS